MAVVWAFCFRAGSVEPCAILTADHATLDLPRQDTEQWMRATSPDAVIVAAAQVGGIAVNHAYPVDFLADNLAIALNVIRACARSRRKKGSCSSAPPASTPG